MLREGLRRYKGMLPLSLRFRFSRKCRRSSLVLCARSKDNGRRLEPQIGDSPRHGFVLQCITSGTRSWEICKDLNWIQSFYSQLILLHPWTLRIYFYNI